MLRDIARLLAAFHRLGLVHRDIKPANILDVSQRSSVHEWRLIDLATHASIGTPSLPQHSTHACTSRILLTLTAHCILLKSHSA